jgi:hypothetical protein
VNATGNSANWSFAASRNPGPRRGSGARSPEHILDTQKSAMYGETGRWKTSAGRPSGDLSMIQHDGDVAEDTGFGEVVCDLQR